MGLYHLHIHSGKSESVLGVAKAAGMELSRTTVDELGTHYFFTHPKQRKEVAITIWKDNSGEEYVRMGVSPTCQALAKSFDSAGLLIPFDFKK